MDASFDTIPHSELLKSIAARISDRNILRLIKMWLKAPVEERDENGGTRLTGGKTAKRGTPQGGVISPLLANRYMNRFLKYWEKTEQPRRLRARIVSYADDFVILSRGKAAETLDWTPCDNPARSDLERGQDPYAPREILPPLRRALSGFPADKAYWQLIDPSTA